MKAVVAHAFGAVEGLRLSGQLDALAAVCPDVDVDEEHDVRAERVVRRAAVDVVPP